jgi:hypothetical protein
VVSIASPTATGQFATTSNGITMAGAAADESPIAEVSWTNSRGGSGVASGGSRWTIDRVGLRAGVNDLTISARDAAGNTASARLRVTATDGQAPTITIHGPSPTDTFSTSMRVVNLDGIAADDFEVAQVAWASDRGASGVARGTSRWIAGGVTLQPGVNVIAVTAVDGAGRSATDVLRITVDSQLPALSITSPASNGLYTSASPTVVLTGLATDDAGITQVTFLSDRGPAGMATGTTTWSTPPVRLEQGPNVFTVSARDSSGNIATATLTVVLGDTVAPILSVYSRPQSGAMVVPTDTITLRGVAQDDLGVVQVTWSANGGATGTASGTSSWTAGNIPLGVGANLITITARDAAGNVATATVPVNRQAPAEAASTKAPERAAPPPTAAAAPPAASAAGPAQETAPPTSFAMPFPVPVGSTETQVSPGPVADSRQTQAPVSPGQVTPVATVDTIERPVDDEPAATPPVIAIVAPGGDRYETTTDTLTISGTARHSSGITQVTWTTDQGESGTAVGRERWTISRLRLAAGTTVVTVTAHNAVGDLASESLTIDRQPAAAPALTIQVPTTEPAWTTGARTVALRGLASDNVVRVTWTADWGGAGTASGTRQWTIPTIGLQLGANRITVKAQSRDGRSTERVITVNYSPRRASGR